MKLSTIILLIVVPVLNIALNWSFQATAKTAEGIYLQALKTSDFLRSIAIGFASAFCLLGLYCTKVHLGCGILLMGAISILGGCLLGVIVEKKNLTGVEWTIFFLITVLMIYRATCKAY